MVPSRIHDAIESSYHNQVTDYVGRRNFWNDMENSLMKEKNYAKTYLKWKIGNGLGKIKCFQRVPIIEMFSYKNCHFSWNYKKRDT